MRQYVLLLLLVAISTGCAHYPMNADYRGPAPLPGPLKDEFVHKTSAGVFKESVIKRESAYTLKRIKFLSNHNIIPMDHNVLIDYYEIVGEKRPVIMVLPILGGSNKIAKSFAEYFVKKGFAAVIVHRQKEYTDLDQIEMVDEILRQMVFDHKQAIDWITTQKELDAGRIGLFGVSMGGIKASLIISLDHRIRAGALALVGGDIPYILTYSKERGVIKRREEIMARDALTPEEFHRKLKNAVTCDPMNYAKYADAGKVLMILARFDRVVPYEKGMELRDKMGQPETIVILAGHYTSLPFIYYVKAKSLMFFIKKFK